MPQQQFPQSSDSELDPELQLVVNAVTACLCGLDANGNVTFCNDALLETTGYCADEMIGRNLHEMLHLSRPSGTTHTAGECGSNHAIRAHQATHLVGEFYWRNLIGTETVRTLVAEESFTAGLLRDIGKVILLAEMLGKYRQVLGSDSGSIVSLELEHLGCTRAQVGAYFMSIWGVFACRWCMRLRFTILPQIRRRISFLH